MPKQKNRRKIHIGQEARITLDAFPRVVFNGVISRIAPAARLDDQVKVFDVEIALNELGRELRTGMTANIEIRGEVREQGVVVRNPMEGGGRDDRVDETYRHRVEQVGDDELDARPEAGQPIAGRGGHRVMIASIAAG